MIVVKARPYNVNFSGNGIWYQLYSAAAVTDSSISFELRLQFMRTDGAAFIASAAIPLIPSKGFASFNLQTMLDAELQYGLPQLLNDADVNEVTTQTGVFYIDFREVTATSVDPAWDTQEAEFTRRVIKGGLPEFMFNNNGFWSTFYAAQKPFLTWQLNGRLAAYDERIYLAWYANKELDTVPGTLPVDYMYKVRIFYTDLSPVDLNFDFTVLPNHVYYLPVGGKMMGLNNLYPAKKLWKWSVQVFNIAVPSTPVIASEEFFYELDNRANYNDVQLLYRSSTGGLDTFRIRGVIESSPDYQLQQTGAIRKPYFEDADKVSPTFYQLPAQEIMNYKGDIGHLKKEEQDRLRDIYLQREVYTVQNKRWWPVNFSIKGYTLRKSSDQLWSLPIEYSLAHDGDYYYAPKGLTLGNEYAGTNTCDGIIQDLVITKAFSIDRLTCTINANFSAVSESGQPITLVQYKLSTNNIWVDKPYPYTSPIVFTASANQFITIQLRAICPNSMGGIVKTDIIDTYPPYIPGIDPPPPATNGSIVNNTGRTINFAVRQNGSFIAGGSISDGSTLAFTSPAAAGATVVVQTFGTTVGSGSQLVSNSVSYGGSIGSGVITFTGVNIIGGMVITLR